MLQSVCAKEILGEAASKVTFDASVCQRKVLISISTTTSPAIYEPAEVAILED